MHDPQRGMEGGLGESVALVNNKCQTCVFLSSFWGLVWESRCLAGHQVACVCVCVCVGHVYVYLLTLVASASAVVAVAVAAAATATKDTESNK